MNRSYLEPYRESHHKSNEENYSIGRYLLNDKSMFPIPIARIARSRLTKLWGWEYQDIDGKCEPMWIYDLPDRIEELKEKMDRKLIECGYILLTQEQCEKFKLLI
jgi:hypothetical protein